MRIALLADYYPAYLAAFEAREDLRGVSFEAHRQRLLDDRFGSFVSYRNWLAASGHDAHLLIGNHQPLQRKWLVERGAAGDPDTRSKQDIVLAQLGELRPDVLFVGSMFDYYGEFFRKASALTRAIVCWIACPHPPDLDFSHVRCVVSSIPSFVDAFRARGVSAERLDAAFDEDVLPGLAGVARDVDLSFVGALHGKAHSYRTRSLRGLLAAGFSVDLWGYGLPRKLPFMPTSPLHRAFRGEAWGLEMYRALARSHITLNFHIDVARSASFVGNMRLYEATGCGALLLTDGGHRVAGLFRPGVELDTFDSQGELEEKIRWYAAHPSEREAIARRGQQACVSRHGYRTRIRELEKILLGALA